MQCSFSQEAEIRRWLGNHQGEVTNGRYDALVTLEINFPEQQLAQWQAFTEAMGVQFQSIK
ncbi:MAG: DUF1949 domain-containing protein [Motiliproteus sp.]|nr:DUF1949 domain-containing protein [Motiliproteus sp.]